MEEEAAATEDDEEGTVASAEREAERRRRDLFDIGRRSGGSCSNEAVVGISQREPVPLRGRASRRLTEAIARNVCPRA